MSRTGGDYGQSPGTPSEGLCTLDGKHGRVQLCADTGVEVVVSSPAQQLQECFLDRGLFSPEA